METGFLSRTRSSSASASLCSDSNPDSKLDSSPALTGSPSTPSAQTQAHAHAHPRPRPRPHSPTRAPLARPDLPVPFAAPAPQSVPLSHSLSAASTSTASSASASASSRPKPSLNPGHILQPKPEPLSQLCRHRSSSNAAPFVYPAAPQPRSRLHSPRRRVRSLLARLLPAFASAPEPALPTLNPRTGHAQNAQLPLPRLVRMLSGALVLGVFLGVYCLLCWLLDQPNALRLDPTIDPQTLFLRPEGDPLGRVPTRQPSRSAAAVAQERAERDAGFHLRIQHAVHPNITTLGRTRTSEALALARDELSSTPAGKNFAWYASDPALVANGPPSRFRCEPDSPTLLFIGIFTTPAAVEKRSLIRTVLKPDLPPDGLVELKFISGEPANENWAALVEAEQRLYGDIEVLEGVRDNVDEGKTFEYLKWIVDREERKRPRHRPDPNTEQQSLRWSERVSGAQQDVLPSVDDRDPRRPVFGKPKFVIKTDDDTFLVIPNLLKSFNGLNCQENVYWGTSKGASGVFDSYFRGLGYGLSWPLVEWMGSSKMSEASRVGIEDARVGAWLTDIRPASETVVRVDEGGRMGDWNQLEIDAGVIGLHWLKMAEWFPMVRLKVLKAWQIAGQKYVWDWHLSSSAGSLTGGDRASLAGSKSPSAAVKTNQHRSR